MKKPQPKSPEATVEWLVEQITAFLKLNPGMSEESFGWCSCRDSSIFPRLAFGGDLTTRKMDQIISYMKAPIATERSGLILKPLTLKRKIYE